MVINILKWLFAAVLVVLIAVFLFLFGMRFSDGPVAIIAGGPFASGELHQGPEPDWADMSERAEVAFQLLDPPRSRTTWIAEHKGRIFIPSGYMTTTIGKLWKQWPAEAEVDGRALLRVDDVIYKRTLVRVTEDPALEPVLRQLARKYVGPMMTPEGETPDYAAVHTEMLHQVADGTLWLFELQPR